MRTRSFPTVRVLALALSPLLGGCMYSIDAVRQLTRRDCVALVEVARSEAPAPEVEWHATCPAQFESFRTTRRGRFRVELPNRDCERIEVRPGYDGELANDAAGRCVVSWVSDEQGVRVYASDKRLLGGSGPGVAPPKEWRFLATAALIDAIYAPFIILSAPTWLPDLVEELARR